jgi:hypothetical protein
LVITLALCSFTPLSILFFLLELQCQSQIMVFLFRPTQLVWRRDISWLGGPLCGRYLLLVSVTSLHRRPAWTVMYVIDPLVLLLLGGHSIVANRSKIAREQLTALAIHISERLPDYFIVAGVALVCHKGKKLVRTRVFE